MKVFLIANDAGESKCIESINYELLKRSHETFIVCGNGKHLILNQTDISAALWSDIVLSTISNDNKAEIGIAQAARKQDPRKPIVVYAPGSYAFQLKGTEPLRDIVDLLLISNENEVAEAHALYSNARVKAIGNILYEEFAPTCSVEESRQIVGFAENKKIIFVPGNKAPSVNWPLFHSVVEATHRREILKHSPIIAIGLHPSTTPTEEDAERETKFYHDAVRFSRKVPVQIFTKFIMPSSILVTACDLLITACSTLAINAIYQRKPVIGFNFELMLADIEVNAGKKFEWKPEINGAADVIRRGSIDNLAIKIDELLWHKSTRLKLMQEKQKIHYPEPPNPGSTAKKAVDLIENLIESRKSGVGDTAP